MALLLLAGLATAPLRGDVLKDLLKSLETSAKQELNRQVEAVRTQAETSAEVSSFDYSRRPSFLVVTSNGRRFQLSAVSLASDRDLDSPLAMSTRAGFSFAGGDAYDVSFTFRSIQPTGSGLLAGVLAGAANDYAGKNLSRVRAQISAVLGRALDGSDWVLPLDRVRLQSIEVLEADGSAPAPVRTAQSPSGSGYASTRAYTPPPAPTPTPEPAPMPVTYATPEPPRVTVIHVDPPPPPPAPTLAAAPPPAVPRARLRRIEGSLATCDVDDGLELRAGMTVVVVRGGTRVAKGTVLDRRPGEADLEITESFAGREPQRGDLVRIEGN